MTNVITFPTRRADTFPYYLDRWPFITVVEAMNSDSLPIRGRADTDGPVIEYHPRHVEPEAINDPSIAFLWLSPCLMQIATAVIAESMKAVKAKKGSIGRFRSPRWHAFRKEVCARMGMEWREILDLAEREGIDWTADDMTASLLLEKGGLADDLETA